MKKIILLGFLLGLILSAGHVCSEDELIRELKEDIEDNGLLDCLRIVRTPFEASETDYQIQARIASQWDSDCSFEAEKPDGSASWMGALQKNFGVKKLVDVYGEQVDQDFSDQADMCEIVRSLIAAGKFNNYEFLDQISCYGDDGQTKVCAATSAPFMDKQRWVVLFDAVAMTFGKAPAFKIDEDA